MKIIGIIFIILACFQYMLILGASKSKTDAEREFEDFEQTEWIRNYRGEL